MQQENLTRLSNLNVLLIDIDHVVHHYDADYARQFSIATVESFLELHPDLAARYDFDDLVEKAVESYQKTGRTTAWFAEEFKIDEMELYVHHHDSLCEDGGYIAQQFQNGKIAIDPEIGQLISQLKDKGMTIVFVTNGTENYGRMVLGDRGHDIAKHADGIIGMDSVDNPYMLDKRHGAFINDVLDKIGLLKRFPKHVHMGMDDFDHSDIGLIDDTHRNLRAPKDRFNIHTILQRNNTAIQGPSWSDGIVHSFKDFLRDVLKAKSLTQPRLRIVG